MSTSRVFRKFPFLCLVLFLAFSSLQPALAKEETPHVRITQVDTTRFPQVKVYVSVTKADGEPLGVDPSRIHLYEDGQIIQPGRVTGAGAVGPLTTMLVMDVSGSMNNGGKLQAAKQAAKAYVDQMRPDDQAGLISFNTAIKVVQAVTADHPALYTSIDNLTAKNDTAMFDALMKAIKVLEPLPGRKAIIVLTDGLDNSSSSNRDQVVASVGASGLSISTIGLGDPAAGKNFFGLNESSLRKLASRAGGIYAFAEDSSALQDIYQGYGRALQSEFAITYTSPSTLRDGIRRILTASLDTSGSQAASATDYNPGGVLPEVAGSSPILFGGTLAGLVALIFIPGLVGLIFHRRTGTKKSRIKLK